MGVSPAETDHIDIALQPLGAEDSAHGELRVPNRVGRFQIGRSDDCELQLKHLSVSLHHATLERKENGELELSDLGSSNGTFLNDERVDCEAVTTGDCLRFGEVEFRAITRRSGSDCSLPVEELESKSPEKDSLDEDGRALTEKNRNLQRELDDIRLREEKIRENLRETRQSAIEKEGEIAHISYQWRTTAEALKKAEARSDDLERICAELKSENSRMREEQARLEARMRVEREARDEADRFSAGLLSRLSDLADKLLDDWKDWFSDGEKCDTNEGIDGIFARVEEVALKIRGELDLIEPIWLSYGAGVEMELKSRCERQQKILSSVESEVDRRSSELHATREDLKELHCRIDEEIRRVQAMNRSGLHLEIPQRFEPMVIPRDREREVCRLLITQVDSLNRFVEIHHKGSGLRGDIAREMIVVRDRLTDILNVAGVEEFRVEEGLVLTPAHLSEVQILEKKGWGVRQFIEKPFQPGKVTQVLRPGYRIGNGEESVVLRKVEVLIRNLEKG